MADRPEGVAVTLAGADGRARTLEARAFIGADGVHSRTRTAIVDGPPARFGRRIAWRTLLPYDSVAGQIGLDRVSVLFGPGYHMVCYPLPHRREVNLALFTKGTQADAERGQPAPPRPGPRLEVLLSAARQGWTPWPLYTVPPGPWHQGHVGLIGDAAHAMVPFQAQGAAMAIEDAATLAPLIATAPTPDEAFAAYSRTRRPRVARVAGISAANGRIFHLPPPLGLARDLGMRALGPRDHIRRLGWLYGHDALAQPSLE